MADTAFVDGSTLTAAAWFNDANTLTYAVLGTVAGTNTITAAGPVTLSAYATGQRFWLIPANTNTGATTINITPSGGAALGAKNIYSGGGACVGGELVANVPALIHYDGTQFNIIGGDLSSTTASTFTFNGSGGTTASKTLSHTKRGKFVTLNIPAMTATSGTGSTSLTSNTALPASIRPTANQSQPCNNIIDNNSGTSDAGQLTIKTDGVIEIVRHNLNTAWTNSSTCGIGAYGVTVTYFLG